MRDRGYSLVEILIALGIGVLILGLLLTITLANRRLYVLDQSRTASNQNLRAALDLVVTDIRQAGERLPADFPAVEVRGGNEILVRRNLHDEVLLLCAPSGIQGNQDRIPVAVPNANIGALPEAYRNICRMRDNNNNGMDDRIEAWRAYRCQQDGNPSCAGGNQHEDKVWAYIYDPQRGVGEWFLYDAEDNSGFQIHKGNGPWQRRYDLGARLYLLEERRYFVANGLLMLGENGEPTTQASGVVAGVRDFQVWAQVAGNRLSTFPQTGQSWRNLEGIELRLRVRTGNLEREMVTRAVPRNVLSQ